MDQSNKTLVKSSNVLFESKPLAELVATPVATGSKIKLSKQEKKLLRKRKQREQDDAVNGRDAKKRKLLEIEDEEDGEEVKGAPATKSDGAASEEEDEVEEDEYMFKPGGDTKGKKKAKTIDVEFELVQPSEAYYHLVRALLN